MLISIAGQAGAGKDLTAKLIQYYLYTHKKPTIPVLFEQTEFVSLNSWLDQTDDTHVRYSKWEIKKFADPVRKITSILLNCPLEFTYTDEFKHLQLPKEWDKFSQITECDENGNDGYGYVPYTGRSFMQTLATDAIRDVLHPDTWLISAFRKYVPGFTNWIFSDMRYSNEYNYVKKLGGTTIKIVRNDATSNAGNHSSENGLNDVEFDYTIYNNGTIQDLYDQIKIIFDSFKK
jgi:hypothetical protein